MKQGQTGLIRHDVDFDLLPRGHHDHVLADSRRPLGRDANDLERVTVQVYRVIVRALVVEAPTIALTALDDNRIGLWVWLAVDRPVVPVLFRLEDHREGRVRITRRLAAAECGDVPLERAHVDPPR